MDKIIDDSDELIPEAIILVIDDGQASIPFTEN